MFKKFFCTVMVAVILCLGNVQAAEKGVNIFAHSRATPESKIVDQFGKSYKLSDFKGKFVMAVFWSRNCPPCIKELKSLNTFHNIVKNNGIHLLLISPAQEWTSAAEQKRFLRRFGAGDVEFYTDSKGKLASDFGIFTNPHTVLINAKGEEIGRIRGRAQWDDSRVIDYIYEIKNNHI